MRLDHITKDHVEVLRFGGSAANLNWALRTLRRMLHKGEEWDLLIRVPKSKLWPVHGRKLRLDDNAEEKLLTAAKSFHWKPEMFELFRDVIILAREHRNEERARALSYPYGKPRSDRAYEVLRARAPGKAEGWLFPSARSRCGDLMDLGKQFRIARRKAQLPEDLVWYCARHDYGARVLSNTGNLAAMMRTMGHNRRRVTLSPGQTSCRIRIRYCRWIHRAFGSGAGSWIENRTDCLKTL